MSIEIKGLTLTYSPHTAFETVALDNVTLCLESGSFVGIMGHTGCGKSTLLQLIAGLVQPTTGHILLDGADIHDKQFDRMTLRKKIGMVFQYPECQLFETTVARDVAFGLKHASLSQAEMERRVKWALETVGFDYESVKKVSPLSLSGGEKRRVAIAGVLAVNPAYLLLDEPIAGLDPMGREQFLNLLKKLNDGGMTVIMVSHNADSIARYADRVVVLEHGHVAADGRPDAILSDVSALSRTGLATSQCAQIAQMMRIAGFPLPGGIVDYQPLLDAIVRCTGGDVSP